MDPEKAAQGIIEKVNEHDCMDPKKASQKESLDFLEIIIDDLTSSANALREEIGDDE